MSYKIPATVITGFLGAGKTSLIMHLLAKARGKRIALVINEFGECGIDGEILRGCGVADCEANGLVELTNGCICCTVADDFVPTLETLLKLPEPPEHIVIETSGLALPKPLVKAFNWPEIRTRVTVDGVVTVVDARAVADGQFASDPAALQAQREADDALDHESPLEELFEEQLGCADLVVLNKTDLLDEATTRRIRSDIASAVRPAVKLVHAAHGGVDPTVVLGLYAAAESDLDEPLLTPRRRRAARPRRLCQLRRGAGRGGLAGDIAGNASTAARDARHPAGQGLCRGDRQGYALAGPGGGSAHRALLRPGLARRRAARDAAGGDRRDRGRRERNPRWIGGAGRLRSECAWAAGSSAIRVSGYRVSGPWAAGSLPGAYRDEFTAGPGIRCPLTVTTAASKA